jgi:hypothetical protein
VIVTAGRLGGPVRVFRPSLAYLVPLAGALVALGLGVETRTVLAAVSLSALVCAFVRAAIEHLRIESARERADEWLACRTGRPPDDELLLARIDELLDPRLRHTLARSFERIAADTRRGGRMHTPAQHNRRVLRHHAPAIVALSDRLADRSRPVSARGMAMAYRLVTLGGSPLYVAAAAEDLGPRLHAVLVALDVDAIGGIEPQVEVRRAA